MTDDAQRLQMIEDMYARSRGSFRGIAEVDVDQMLRMQAEDDAVLVDVRTAAEQVVSMIPGAITSEDFEANRAEYQNRPVVCYCTIGHRSGLYTQRLQAEGFDAHNLKGAILAYTHSGQDLQSEQGPTRAVHVYSRQGRKMVAEGYEPTW
jgi:rhodanese-related sulfurtransferase